MKDYQGLPAGEPVVRPLPGRTNPVYRILVADDDQHIRQLNTEVLINSGYLVSAAADGAAAWQALQANCYDLLITDHNMPKMSGFELLKKLHAVRMVLPVIMVTGTLPEEDFRRHPWLQPAATLLKPYSPSELLGTVRQILRVTGSVQDPIAPPREWPARPSTRVLRF